MSNKIMFAFLLAMAATVLCAPSQKEQHEEALEDTILPVQLMADYEPTNQNVLEEVENVLEEARQPRVTCDLLSWLGWNHSLCAAHCLARGFRGGACNNRGVCVCRR